MNIKLIHPFIVDSRADWTKLLSDVNNLQKFENRIKKYASSETEYLTEDEKGNKIRTFIGDAWEVFVEMLLKSHPFDRRIGISHYCPMHPLFGNEDHGVDGKGIGTNGRIATVQAKFRSKPNYRLTANQDHLSNFLSSSIIEHKVDLNDTENIVIITNCEGLHYHTDEKMLYGKVKCLGRDAVRQFVDNNIPFWDEFRRATLAVK